MHLHLVLVAVTPNSPTARWRREAVICRGCLADLPEGKDRGATNSACATRRGPTILELHRLGVLHLALPFALEAIALHESSRPLSSDEVDCAVGRVARFAPHRMRCRGSRWARGTGHRGGRTRSIRSPPSPGQSAASPAKPVPTDRRSAGCWLHSAPHH